MKSSRFVLWQILVNNLVLSILIYVNYLLSSDFLFIGTALLIIIWPLRRTPLLAQYKGAEENLSGYKELNQVYAKEVSRLYKRVK